MKELKKKISEFVRDYKNIWLEEIKESKKEKRGLNLSTIMMKENDLQHKLELELYNAEERLKTTKKGMFK